MSSPPQGLPEPSGLPSNPYAAEDDDLVQQWWQRDAGTPQAEMTTPGAVAMSTSSTGRQTQPQFSAQGTCPWEVDMTQV